MLTQKCPKAGLRGHVSLKYLFTAQTGHGNISSSLSSIKSYRKGTVKLSNLLSVMEGFLASITNSRIKDTITTE